jgi:hypothetical protein
MEPAERRCSLHSDPGADELDAWACPDDCKEFLAELERRIDDVQVHGNFTRMSVVDGVWYRQTFRNHKSIEQPRPDPLFNDRDEGDD